MGWQKRWFVLNPHSQQISYFKTEVRVLSCPCWAALLSCRLAAHPGALLRSIAPDAAPLPRPARKAAEEAAGSIDLLLLAACYTTTEMKHHGKGVKLMMLDRCARPSTPPQSPRMLRAH